MTGYEVRGRRPQDVLDQSHDHSVATQPVPELIPAQQLPGDQLARRAGVHKTRTERRRAQLRPGTVIRHTGLPVRRLPFVRPLPGTISLEVTTAV